MKKNIFIKKLIRIITLITLGLTGKTFAIGPAIAGLAGVPVLGGIMGAKASSAKELLSQAADVVIYLKLFLFVLFTFSFAFLGLWVFSLIRRKVKQRRLDKIIELLARVQSRMISTKNGEISSGKGTDKDELLKQVCELMKQNKFKRLLNDHLGVRFARALVLLLEDEMELKKQIKLIDRWQQVFMLRV